jgi:hypothetical protein
MRRSLAVLALVALVLTTDTACSKSDAQAPALPSGTAAIKPLPITVAKTESRQVQRTVETVGSLVPWQETVVKSEQPGTISRLLVDLGDAVTAGKILAEYDAREFQLSVEQADADLLSALQSYARAQAALSSSEAALRRSRDGLAALGDAPHHAGDLLDLRRYAWAARLRRHPLPALEARPRRTPGLGWKPVRRAPLRERVRLAVRPFAEPRHEDLLPRGLHRVAPVDRPCQGDRISVGAGQREETG